jgi:uncharacterized protein YbgA (DUF1722 family)/uncharacterized protein YbbK (DUF523 family)
MAAPKRCGTSSLTPELGVLPDRPSPPLNVAVSSCLTGAEVRFDGGHKRSSLCHEQLAGLFELRGICPELAIGMGVPRDPIRLVGDVSAPRARGVKDSSVDVTQPLRDYARTVLPSLADTCGYIFMKGSPTCGLFRVKVYGEPGVPPNGHGRGIFAAEIVAGRPELPVEESGRLEDPVLRENFVTRVFAFAHWQKLVAEGLTAARLIAFHSAYKYLLMAHSIVHYKEAGRLLADLSGDVATLADAYVQVLMRGLSRPATRGGHANVLQHLQGYVKDQLDSATRQELAELIHSYRRGEIPLLAPLTLLRHHLRRAADSYALEQIYLEPHPGAAGLRREL